MKFRFLKTWGYILPDIKHCQTLLKEMKRQSYPFDADHGWTPELIRERSQDCQVWYDNNPIDNNNKSSVTIQG